LKTLGNLRTRDSIELKYISDASEILISSWPFPRFALYCDPFPFEAIKLIPRAGKTDFFCFQPTTQSKEDKNFLYSQLPPVPTNSLRGFIEIYNSIPEYISEITFHFDDYRGVFIWDNSTCYFIHDSNETIGRFFRKLQKKFSPMMLIGFEELIHNRNQRMVYDHDSAGWYRHQ
jgi:hypothetical protein